MSRVAVRPSNSDDIEKLAFLAPLAGAVGRKLATSAIGQGVTAARGATGIGGKLKAGLKAFGEAKAKDIAGADGEDGEVDGMAVTAKLAQQSMANQAKARQDRLQNQKEHNMQMADRAKQDSQISTGEPIDMSWRLLKDWSWNQELSPRARRVIVERARMARKKGKYVHLHSSPSRHHDRQFAERYHPHQKMPRDAAGLEPHEIAAAMADLYLENHPELYQALHEELPQPNDRTRTNTPGMVFHALTTDDPKISDNTSWDTYAPVIAKPNMFAKPMVHTAVNSPISRAGNRHTISVSSARNYTHSYPRHNEIFTSKFNLVNPLSDIKELTETPTENIEEPVTYSPWFDEESERPTESAKLRRNYRIRQLDAGEEKWRNKILNVEGEKSDKIEQNLISRLHNEAMLSEQEDAKQAKQFEAQQAREQQLAAREQGEMSVTPHIIPGHYIVNDPAYALQGKMVGPFDKDVGQGYDYYHNHYQNTIQTGEPMSLAWRLLKREIHPGSLAAYRQMVEDLGDNIPVEQRIAQLLGEGKYLNHPKRFKLHPARPTKQYDYHGDVENLEDIPILNEKFEPFKITDDGFPEHRNLSIYDKHNLSPKRVTYTPEILEREDLPTFAGIPFNEETGFTRSEPMDLAMRMLKFDEDEWFRQHQAEQQRIAELATQGRAEMRDETRSVPCSFCGAEIGEPCIGSPYRSHSARTLALGRKRMGIEEKGKPIGLAWRMLKQMSDEEMQEWAYENLRNQGITIPDEREEEVVPKPEIPTLYY